MKRIILILIIILMPLNGEALNYKTTTNKKDIKENSVIVKQEKLYKYYKEEKIFSEKYYIEGENEDDFPYISDDYIIKTSEEQEEKPSLKPNRIIKETKYNCYQPLKKINRIVFTQINLGVYFYEIEVYENEEKIDYVFSENNDTSYLALNDNKKDTGGQKVLLKTIDILLSKEVNPLDVTIKVYLKKYFNDVSITIDLYPEEVTEKYEPNNHMVNDENAYVRTNKKITFTNDEIIFYDFKIVEENILKYKYDDELVMTTEELDNKLFYKTNEVIKYTYEDKLFKYYQIKRNYLEGYYVNKEGYLKDEKNYITRYTYYTKTKQVNNQKITTNKNIVSQQQTITKTITEKTQNKNNQNKELMALNEIEKENIDNQEIKMSKKEIVQPTKSNKIIYLIPVILLMLLFIFGYLLYKLIKER